MAKHNFSFFILFSIAIVLAAGMAQAETIGIGIKWFTESEVVGENAEHCINYGLYNPFDVDINGMLDATGDLKKISRADEPIPVPKNTSSADAKPAKICFDVPKVYKEDCILGFCKRECPEKVSVEPWKNEIRIEGNIIAVYVLPETALSATGSKTGISGSVPLELVVKCEPKSRNTAGMYATMAGIAVLAALIIFLIARVAKKRRRF